MQAVAVSQENRTYLRNPQSVGVARLFVRAQCLAWGLLPPLVDNTETVVSELVTNAVEYGSGPLVGLRLECVHGTVCVRVRDDNVNRVPAKPDPAAGLFEESGRGLMLTEALSSRWGYYMAADGSGKIVFAVIEGEP